MEIVHLLQRNPSRIEITHSFKINSKIWVITPLFQITSIQQHNSLLRTVHSSNLIKLDKFNSHRCSNHSNCKLTNWFSNSNGNKHSKSISNNHNNPKISGNIKYSNSNNNNNSNFNIFHNQINNNYSRVSNNCRFLSYSLTKMVPSYHPANSRNNRISQH